MRSTTFPPPIGTQKVATMGLDELHELTANSPHLQETGFYVGGFPALVNSGVSPLVYAGMRYAPGTRRHLGHLLDASLRVSSQPPFITYLQLDSGPRTVMLLSHSDGYLLTAAPVVATAGQVLEGATPAFIFRACSSSPAASSATFRQWVS